MPNNQRTRRFGRLEALILIPNILLIAVMLVYVAVTGVDQDAVKPLVDADPQTTARIAQLEEALMRDPRDVSKAIQLSRLYQDVGEFPWSYNALLNAEKNSSDNPIWRLRLGLAYLELGKNDDGLRVMQRALKGCDPARCSANVKIKLQLFTRVARLLKERKIDTRKHPRAAHKALQDVFKPVVIEPEKMRPKGPAQPVQPEQPAPKVEPKS